MKSKYKSMFSSLPLSYFSCVVNECYAPVTGVQTPCDTLAKGKDEKRHYYLTVKIFLKICKYKKIINFMVLNITSSL